MRIIECFLWKNRRRYIGIDWNVFKKNSGEGYYLIEEFLDFVSKKAKRWWTPYWFLNLLNLFGNDNSIVRVKNQTISDLHRKLTNGIRIYDIKTKWGTLRIYGDFTQEINVELKKLEEKINSILEPY